MWKMLAVIVFVFGSSWIITLKRQIKQRKLTEKALRESEEKYRTVFSATNEGIALHEVIYDDSGKAVDYRILDVNPAYESITGIRKSDATGTLASELYGTDEPLYLKKFIDVVSSGKSTTFETTFPPLAKSFLISVVPTTKNKFTTMFTDISYCKSIEEEREKLLHDMGERVKELHCLYQIAESIKERSNIEDIFQDIVDIIPPGWHYPDITRAKVIFGGKEYSKEPFEETPWVQSSDIVVNGKKKGVIKVFYLEEMPEFDEGPFLSEERNLINGISQTLGKAIERKKAANKLRESEEKFRAIYDNHYQLAGLLTPDGTLISANSAALSLVGAKEEDVLGKLYWETPWWAHSAEAQKQIKQGVANVISGKFVSFETINYDAEGRIHYIDFSMKTIKNKNGEVVYIASIGWDITEHKLNELRFKALFEASGDAILILDNEFFVDCNQKASELYNCSREQLIGKTISDFSPANQSDGKESQQNALEKIGKTLAGEPQRFEWKHHRYNGEYFDAEVSLNYVEIGPGEYIQAIIRDITARKRAEQRLQYRIDLEQLVSSISKRFINLPTSEQLDHEITYSLQMISEFIHAERAGIYMLSADKTKINLTHEWYCHEELSFRDIFQNIPVGNYAGLIDALNQQDYLHITDTSSTPPAESLKLILREVKIRTSVLVPMKIHNSLIGFLTISTTRKKDSWRKEDFLMFVTLVDILAGSFEKIKKEKEAEFQRQKLIEMDKMVSLGILVAGVAHEINNPTNFITMNTPILERSWEDIVTILENHYIENDDFPVAGIPYSEMRENIPELFQGLRDGAERIKQIVLNLKDYARQNNTDMTQLVEINEALKATLSLLANPLKRGTHHLSVTFAEDLPRVRGNFQRIEQVFINIIQNSCQALPDSSRGIFISSVHDEENNEVIITVADEGCGIAEDIICHIQDPFFTTKRDSGGTGLGLSISASIMQEHGGRLDFSSQVEKGTSVNIILPAHTDA